MSSRPPSDAEPGARAQAFGLRYARWLQGRYRWILWAAIAITALATWLTSRLEVRADFANLLSPERRSVQDIQIIKSRVAAFGSLFVVVEADDPAVREQATRALHQRMQAMLSPELVANLAYDDAPARRFIWENRFLLVDMKELEEARNALKEKIRQAKLRANPLFVDLTDDDDDDAEDDDAALEERIQELRKRLDDAEAALEQPPGFVSRDGRYQLIVIRATFTASEVGQGRELVDGITDVVREIEARYPGIRIGVTGDINTGVLEHRSILRGMVMAALVTILVVALALFLYYRSIYSVLALLWALTVGSVATFGVTELIIGHLNLATAFLAAIVIGNGINPGIILLARFYEELRHDNADADESTTVLGRAISGATRGTMAASLTAGVAYASLIVTDFRGFRHFGIIGAIGMVLCWIAAFTVLPAGLTWLRARIKPHAEPAIGRFLARMMPRRLRTFAVFGMLLTALSGYVTWRYVDGDPLEDDWRNLRSTSDASLESRYWDELIKAEFDRGFNRNQSGRFVIALPDRAMVRPLYQRLHKAMEGDDLFLYVRSIDDLVPPDQDAKRAILNEIRKLIDSEIAEEVEGEDRELMMRVRPPDEIRPLGFEDVPADLSWLFTETDGSVGRIIHAASSMRFDTWNVHHLVAFSDHVRALGLPEEAIVGGQAFVFADMLRSMEEDGPETTIFALVGSVLAVWLVIGLRRHGLVTLLCAAAGTLGMIAFVAIYGLKVNFLDFIALPITVGIGIDYAVNIAARERQDGERGPRYVLATTGGAVFLCSFTTTVGYGSLLLSENAGIRSFGMAALLGEISCMIAALILAPTFLALWRRRDSVDRR